MPGKATLGRGWKCERVRRREWGSRWPFSPHTLQLPASAGAMSWFGKGAGLRACTAPGGAQDTSWCPIMGTSQFTSRSLVSPGSNTPYAEAGSLCSVSPMGAPSPPRPPCCAGRERNGHMGTRREGEGEGSARPSARTSLPAPGKASCLLGVRFSCRHNVLTEIFSSAHTATSGE